jgi:hypothetical protein
MGCNRTPCSWKVASAVRVTPTTWLVSSPELCHPATRGQTCGPAQDRRAIPSHPAAGMWLRPPSCRQQLLHRAAGHVRWPDSASPVHPTAE